MEGGESPAEPGSGPARRFPVAAVEEILRDVLGSALRERRYEPGPCLEAAKDIAEVRPGRTLVPPWVPQMSPKMPDKVSLRRGSRRWRCPGNVTGSIWIRE
ncbi:dynein light chain Tctex-type 5 isoform X3 [Ammospiza nelsoni]|uniref:dynein light chain Tctex-type 5 isoform X3 n=1 Tax=Ammospiza nelsoni TaxID=2857394 RepID=UPI00286B6E4D|nr:dynein light chain Tctex-type 5 isoform X3 [Ammospiza nelsoni]